MVTNRPHPPGRGKLSGARAPRRWWTWMSGMSCAAAGRTQRESPMSQRLPLRAQLGLTLSASLCALRSGREISSHTSALAPVRIV